MEDKSVRLHIDEQDVAHLRDDASFLITRSSEQVDVHGGTELLRTPDSQHQCTLENESPGMSGSGQPVEKSLHGEVLEQFAEEPPLTPGLVQEALPDGAGHISWRRHMIASK